MSQGKIALFVPSLVSGGAERIILNLSRGFAARGFEVDLILTRAHGELLTQVPNGVRIVNLNAARTLSTLPVLSRYLKAQRPTALLAALPHCNLVALWARLLSRVRTRVAVSEHGILSESLRSGPFIERFFPSLMRITYPCADGIVTVSQRAADDLAAHAGLRRESITVINNPVVTPELESMARAPLAHPWFVQGESPVILSAGRLNSAKDFPTLLRAFAILRKMRPVRLIILGDGEERAALESLADSLGIADDLAMPGYDSNPFAYMTRSRVFALSSRWEGFGNVLVEALACGTQVVSTDCPGGPVEILDGGRFGWLTPVGDAAALADALAQAIDHPMPPEKLIARATDFALDSITDKYLCLLVPGFQP